jgi:hypothetical protein
VTPSTISVYHRSNKDAKIKAARILCGAKLEDGDEEVQPLRESTPIPEDIVKEQVIDVVSPI